MRLSFAVTAACSLALAALSGCFDARSELLDTTSGSGSGSAASSGGSGSTGGTTGGTASTGTGATSSSSSSGGQDAGPLANFCTDLEATLATLSPELSACNLAAPQPTQAQCLAQAATCSTADLVALQTFLTCIDAIPMGSCSSLFGPLFACTGPVNGITCFSLMGGTSGGGGGGSSSGSSGGIGPFDGGFPTPTPYCGACTRSRQCGRGNACLLDGQNQQVCGQSCSQGQPCPGGSSCQMTTDVAMHATTQCVPAACGLADAG